MSALQKALNRRERRRAKFQQHQQVEQKPTINYYGPKTQGQRQLKSALDNNRFVVIAGPAGSGKTLLAVQRAVELLVSEQVKRIVLARPAVEADEKIGFLPGGIKEKLDPYLRPLYDAIEDIVGDTSVIDKWLRESKLTIAPLGYLRGRTFKGSCVVFDEAQNATYSQLTMVITRLGDGSHMFFTGDPKQSDIGVNSGYPELIGRLRCTKYPVVELTNKDVVRDPIVAELLEVL